MEDMLKVVKTERVLPVRSSIEDVTKISKRPSSPAKSPHDALRILKEGPDIDEVEGVLNFLQTRTDDAFDISSPSALAAQIIQILVAQTIPDFWNLLRNEKYLLNIKNMLLDCVRSISGLGAILTRLKALTAASQNKSKPGPTTGPPEQVHILVKLLEGLFHGNNFVLEIWKKSSTGASNAARRTIMWKEFISLVATSRLTSAVAEAEDALKESGKELNGSWIGRGSEYTRWIALNIVRMVLDEEDDDEEKWVAAGGICSKALIMGYTGN
jgi:telomere length regulation protein